MKFCILCIGSHGDIRPYIALAIGLKNKGYDVTIASHKQAQWLCQKFNVNFQPVGGDLTELLGDPSTREILHQSSKKLATFYKVIHAFKNVLAEQLSMSFDAVKGHDVLIYSPAAFAGPHLVEHLNIPGFRMALQPDARTKYYPNSLFPNQWRLGGAGYLFGHLLAEQIFWQPVRKQINKWRQEKLSLKKINLLGPMYDSFSKEIIHLIAFNSKLVAPAPDWSMNTYMTNFCRIVEEPWQADAELNNFIERGNAPIYIGFGSLTAATPKDVVATMLSVIRKRKIRAIVLANLPGLKDLQLTSNIFPIKYAPHDWLFPRVLAVIHHGGIGTTAAGLYAGKPTLVMPFLLDQFYWGKKVYEWRVGPTSLPIKKFSEQLFDLRLRELLQNNNYQMNANNLMLTLRKNEDGVECTVKTILNILEKN